MAGQKAPPRSQETDLETLKEGEWEGKTTQGDPPPSRAWWGLGSSLRARVREPRTHGHSLRQMSARVAGAPPTPENQRHPSRGEEGGSLIINSAGGKVRPPAHSRAPLPIIMPARLLSPRAHAESLLLYFGLFSVSSAFYARGRVLRGQSILPRLLSLLQSF